MEGASLQSQAVVKLEATRSSCQTPRAGIRLNAGLFQSPSYGLECNTVQQLPLSLFMKQACSASSTCPSGGRQPLQLCGSHRRSLLPRNSLLNPWGPFIWEDRPGRATRELSLPEAIWVSNLFSGPRCGMLGKVTFNLSLPPPPTPNNPCILSSCKDFQ